jgi:mannose-1-phosphate guanylyltransferase
MVKEQLPGVLADHVFVEPVRRDLAAAVGLALLRLQARGKSGTVAILWADHFMDYPDRFVDALKHAETLVEKDPSRFVFFGEKARFANHNLGWIHMGGGVEARAHAFLEWKYKPDLDACRDMFASGAWLWNTGYFVFNIDTALSLYKTFEPAMLHTLQEIVADESKLHTLYPTVPAKSFDAAIIERMSRDQAVVLPVDLGWSDPGTLYALKEALVENTEDRVVKGEVMVDTVRDSLIINEEPEKMVVAVGIDGLVIVNTKDALLICHKDSVPKISGVVKQLEIEGKEHLI